MGSTAEEVADAPKVDVTLYYESLCPGCHDFILNDLAPALPEIGSIMNVNLIPYGNAKTSSSGVVTCQHGTPECQGNTWSDCAIQHYPAFDAHFPFIQCLEQNFNNQLASVQACAKTANLDYNLLNTCATSTEGHDLLVAFGKRTGAHSYVPWVLIDGVQSTDDDFVGAVCAKYTGTKPAACAGHTKTVSTVSSKCFNLDTVGKYDAATLAQFDEFMKTHEKTYSTEDAKMHALANFQATLIKVAESGNPTWGITKFADLSPEEFRAMYLTLKPRTEEEIAATPKYDETSCAACKRFPEHADAAPTSIDWTTKGAVVGVKDQGQCGAFAASFYFFVIISNFCILYLTSNSIL